MKEVRSTLDSLALPYDLIPIDPAFADTAAFCERYGYPPDRSLNTLIVASKKEPRVFAACVVLATTRLDVNRAVRKHLCVSKLSFATADEMKTLTGMEVGGVTAIGLPPGLRLLVDARVMEPDWIVLGGGGRDFKIKTSPRIFEKLGAEIVPDLALDSPAA